MRFTTGLVFALFSWIITPVFAGDSALEKNFNKASADGSHKQRQGHGKRKGGKGHGMANFLKNELNLSEEQQKQIREVHMEQKKVNKEFYQRFRKLRRDFESLKENGSEDQLISVGKELGEMNARRVLMHRNIMSRIAPILSPEQLQKFKEFQKKRREKPRRKHGKAHMKGKHDRNKEWKQNLSPDQMEERRQRRQERREKWKNMSAEEREEMKRKMKERRRQRRDGGFNEGEREL